MIFMIIISVCSKGEMNVQYVVSGLDFSFLQLMLCWCHSNICSSKTSLGIILYLTVVVKTQ